MEVTGLGGQAEGDVRGTPSTTRGLVVVWLRLCTYMDRTTTHPRFLTRTVEGVVGGGDSREWKRFGLG